MSCRSDQDANKHFGLSHSSLNFFADGHAAGISCVALLIRYAKKMMKNKRSQVSLRLVPFLIATSMGLLSGCAHLHHVQVGQIDNRNALIDVPFEVLMSETGVSTEEIGAIARATRTGAGKDAGNVAAIIGLFQMGPRTGNPVYNERYAEKLVYEIYRKCPSGRVSNLVSIREMRKYPVISGEIVKVTGVCREARTTAQLSKSEGTSL